VEGSRREGIGFFDRQSSAKRFMYFRFVVSYIFAQKNSHASFLAKVENGKEFWASPGEYLRRSTLIFFISGLELPPSILKDKTFEGPDPDSPPFEEVDNSAILLSAHLRDAYVASVKDTEEEDLMNTSDEL